MNRKILQKIICITGIKDLIELYFSTKFAEIFAINFRKIIDEIISRKLDEALLFAIA